MHYSIYKTGTTVTSSGTSQAVEVSALGFANTKYVRVVTPPAQYAFIKFGPSTVTATANDIMVTSDASVFAIGGTTHIAVLQGSTAALVNITPHEGQR